MMVWVLMEKKNNDLQAEVIGVEAEEYIGFFDVTKRTFLNRKFSIFIKGSVFEVGIELNILSTNGAYMVASVNNSGNLTRDYVALRKGLSVATMKASPSSNLVSGFYVSPEARLDFTTAMKMLKANPKRPVKMLVVGPSGYGKSTLPRLVAELLGMNYKRMNCATIRDPEEWFGFREAENGSTVFHMSDFAKLMTKGNAVIVLDELNRLEPWLHNTLYPLLDDDAKTVVHDQEFAVGEGVLFVATINQGYKFTGTFELDEALVNRFDFVLEVGELPDVEEERVLVERTGVSLSDSKEVVKLAKSLRQMGAVCSVRTTLLVASKLVNGMTIREAFDSAVVRRIPTDSNGSTFRKSVMDLINTKVGYLKQRIVPDDIFGAESEGLETTANKVVATLTIQPVENVAIGFVSLIQIVRTQLALYGGMPTMKETRELLDGLRHGNAVTLQLAELLPYPEQVMNEIDETGVVSFYNEVKDAI